MAILRLDPWAPDYEGSYNELPEEQQSEQPLDTDFEVPAADWHAIGADTYTDFPELVFLDGSRRMEMRAYLEQEDGQLISGGLGTYATGTVVVRPGQPAEYGELRVRRVSFLAGGAATGQIAIRATGSWEGDLVYDNILTGAQSAGELGQELQKAMRDDERILAVRSSGDHPAALIILDGPLPRPVPGDRTVGYLKTIGVLRLAPEQMQVVKELKAGHRSPMYVVGNPAAGQAIIEWWLRLRDPQDWHFSLAGTVRLQVPYAAGEDWARRVAAWSCAALPGYASLQFQDPRAPQQLLPVRALEAELRRRMGHPGILRRRLLAGHFALEAGR